MRIAHFFRHLFVPHESNNLKAKLLHPSSLVAIKAGFIIFQVLLYVYATSPLPKVLGYAAQISPQEVIRLTNEKRAQAGLPALRENPNLDQGALAKGTDMLNRNYWAHVAPDGTEPWTFFINAGYKYRYAGENLARDFSNPSSTVDAWMASPSHRENLLSNKYKDIGVAVVEGNLNGVDTTLVVQFFGTKFSDTLPVEPVAKAPIETIAPATPVPSSSPTAAPVAVVLPSASPTESPSAQAKLTAANPDVLVSPFVTTKGVSLAVVGLLLAIFVIDAIVTSRRRIRRIGGRTFAHLAFLGMITAIIIILRAGQVL